MSKNIATLKLNQGSVKALTVVPFDRMCMVSY